MKSMNSQTRSVAVAILAPICLALVLGGCAATRRTRSAAPQGFLGDYSQLKKGEKGDDPQLMYISPTANFRKYNAIMIDSVTIWHQSEAAKISAKDQQMLTDLLYAAVRKELSKDYEIVQRPGPGVMRLRGAITEAKGANVAGNTVTTVVPQLKILATAGGVATDTQVFVGKAGVEAEMVDSLTNQRLMAAVAERAGAKTFQSLGGKWKDVQLSFEFWAERLRKRLEELRAR